MKSDHALGIDSPKGSTKNSLSCGDAIQAATTSQCLHTYDNMTKDPVNLIIQISLACIFWEFSYLLSPQTHWGESGKLDQLNFKWCPILSHPNRRARPSSHSLTVYFVNSQLLSWPQSSRQNYRAKVGRSHEDSIRAKHGASQIHFRNKEKLAVCLFGAIYIYPFSTGITKDPATFERKQFIKKNFELSPLQVVSAKYLLPNP